MPSRFWQQAHDLERLEQLRYDAKEFFGALITLAYVRRDDSYARAVDVQYRTATAYLDRAINAVLAGHTDANAAVQPASPGEVIERLKSALLCAFSRDELQMMVRTQLGEGLDAVAGDGTLDVVVFRLIEWSQRTGNWDRLLDGALAANPGNKALVDTVAGIRQPA